jgi:hypothetical protein
MGALAAPQTPRQVLPTHEVTKREAFIGPGMHCGELLIYSPRRSDPRI